ncbi:hypothetical protein HQ45_05410 [Porphyromonas crevioricanis]|nr:hypothetical protein HQ45_05410 [Porphyromonas crevioricanis]
MKKRKRRSKVCISPDIWEDKLWIASFFIAKSLFMSPLHGFQNGKFNCHLIDFIERGNLEDIQTEGTGSMPATMTKLECRK